MQEGAVGDRSAQDKIRVRDALKSSLIQQSVAFIFSGLGLDEQRLFLIVIYALAAFWAGTAMILRQRRVSGFDALFLKWGFLVLCVVSFFLARWIWVWRSSDS